MEFKEKFEISVRCPICGEYHSIFVERSDYYKWLRSHSSVQEIFPYLNAEEREIIISGTCPSCWDKLFSKESA